MDSYPNSLEQLLGGLGVIDLYIRRAVACAWQAGVDPTDHFRGLYITPAEVHALLACEVGDWLWHGGAFADPGPGSNGLAQQHTTATNLQQWSVLIAEARASWEARTANGRAAGITFRLAQLADDFQLSPLEVDVLLIALAPEIDPRYQRLYAYLQDDVSKKRPTVDLILNLLSESLADKVQRRRLFDKNGRLVCSRLLLVERQPEMERRTLLERPVRLSAAVVEYLLGSQALDDRLPASARLLAPDPAAYSGGGELPGPNKTQLDQAAATQQPLFLLFLGEDEARKVSAAHYLATAHQRRLLFVDLLCLAESAVGLEEGLRLVVRDGRLAQAMLCLRRGEALERDGELDPRLLRRLFTYPYGAILCFAKPRPFPPLPERPSLLTMRFERPNYQERHRIWEACLSPYPHQAAIALDQVAGQFRLSSDQIRAAAAAAHDLAWEQRRPITTADLLAACRLHSNQKLAELATRVTPSYGWEELVLPADSKGQLREMVMMARQSPFVYEQWGFGDKMTLGKGISALFFGDSGTGKTMAASLIAAELGLELYQIDLSRLVSKYIGETEKNLGRIFREAATSNAILFFDEADAIFGRRSAVRDSHDRYANLEVSYLLQQMEQYEGVVILASNLSANIDEAFARRLRFAIYFPAPTAAERECIWRRSFPAETPCATNIDFGRLAERFELTGGHIRNIVLAAAFLAAESGKAVGMTHLLRATRREYQKLGRLIDESWFVEEAE